MYRKLCFINQAEKMSLDTRLPPEFPSSLCVEDPTWAWWWCLCVLPGLWHLQVWQSGLGIPWCLQYKGIETLILWFALLPQLSLLTGSTEWAAVQDWHSPIKHWAQPDHGFSKQVNMDLQSFGFVLVNRNLKSTALSLAISKSKCVALQAFWLWAVLCTGFTQKCNKTEKQAASPH